MAAAARGRRHIAFVGDVKVGIAPEQQLAGDKADRSQAPRGPAGSNKVLPDFDNRDGTANPTGAGVDTARLPGIPSPTCATTQF